MKGWRVASTHSDCMNGDYTKVRLIGDQGAFCLPTAWASMHVDGTAWFQKSVLTPPVQVDLHTRYFENARKLLNVISPDHTTRFNECVAEKLKNLEV